MVVWVSLILVYMDVILELCVMRVGKVLYMFFGVSSFTRELFFGCLLILISFLWVGV